MSITKEQLEKTIKKIVEAEVQNYFRMARPGFEIVSNNKTELYGLSEFALTTDEAQALHFYKSGVAKLLSNKSLEIISGVVSKDDLSSLGVGIYAKNGNIHIRADNGDVIIEGKTVKVEAFGTVVEKPGRGLFKVHANTEVTMTSPQIKLEGENAVNIRGDYNLTMLGGEVSIFSLKTPVEISDGVELELSDGSVEEFIQRIESFEAMWDEGSPATDALGRDFDDPEADLSVRGG